MKKSTAHAQGHCCDFHTPGVNCAIENESEAKSCLTSSPGYGAHICLELWILNLGILEVSSSAKAPSSHVGQWTDCLPQGSLEFFCAWNTLQRLAYEHNILSLALSNISVLRLSLPHPDAKCSPETNGFPTSCASTFLFFTCSSCPNQSCTSSNVSVQGNYANELQFCKPT